LVILLSVFLKLPHITNIQGDEVVVIKIANYPPSKWMRLINRFVSSIHNIQIDDKAAFFAFRDPYKSSGQTGYYGQPLPAYWEPGKTTTLSR